MASNRLVLRRLRPFVVSDGGKAGVGARRVATSPSESAYSWYHNEVLTVISGDNVPAVRLFIEAYLRAARAA
ncbi:MAG TPA: hypothetical protein VNF47_15650 [Streptosporangiaceae bacterium]|nr:hypothetical protein [Streptosporangiaceae bacterium]